MSSVESCHFCRRPITPEFAYRKPTAANAQLCTRKDCRKARKCDAEQALREAEADGEAAEAASIRLQETGHEEGDATTDSNKGTPGKHYDCAVKSDLDDDSVPKLLKIRLDSGSNGANELFERSRRAAHFAAQHPAQPRRGAFNPLVNPRASIGEPGTREMIERVAAIESSSSKPKWSRRYDAEQLLALLALEHIHKKENGSTPSNAPTSEKLTIDNIRNTWLREKVEGDNRVLLDTITPCTVDGVYSFRLSLALTVQNLAAFIRDEKFKTTPAISRRETTFYKDYAKGEELSVELMVKRHGVWGDEEIVELENRVIRHAAAVGLIVRPPHMFPEQEWEPEDEQFKQTVIKTGGAEIGGGITEEKREDGRRRNGSSFNTRPPRTWVDPDKPGPPSADAGWWDRSDDSELQE